MKVFFLKEDSLYKIFRTLQKLPKKKSIEVYIESKSPFFQHERWGTQIKEIIDDKDYNITFATNNKENRNYYKKLNLPVKFLKENKLEKILKLVYLFFFNIKKFHLHLHSSSKNYIFYMIFSFEVIVILGVLYLLYGLILPKTTIEINPNYINEEVICNFRYYPHDIKDFSQNTNKITVPYYTGSIKLSHSSNLLLDSILFKETPATGTLRIVNKTKDTFNLVKGTQFITDDGLIFRSTHFVTIYSKNKKGPGIMYVNVKADKYDIKSRMIGVRGNLKKDTKLYIRKLKQSFYQKEIYADVLFDFVGGSTTRDAQLQTGDLEILKNRIKKYLETKKISMIRKNIKKEENILIPFKKLILGKGEKFSYSYPKLQQTGAMLFGKFEEEVVYFYVKKQDLLKAFAKFLKKRSGNIMDIVSFNDYSITFLQNKTGDKKNTIIIPTKINVVKGYDFQKDINGIMGNIKENIVGKKLKGSKNAYNYIYSFPEIGNVKIDVSPSWYDSVSKLKSRIYFKIKEK